MAVTDKCSRGTLFIRTQCRYKQIEYITTIIHCQHFNPLKYRDVNWLHFAIQV